MLTSESISQHEREVETLDTLNNNSAASTKIHHFFNTKKKKTQLLTTAALKKYIRFYCLSANVFCSVSVCEVSIVVLCRAEHQSTRAGPLTNHSSQMYPLPFHK